MTFYIKKKKKKQFLDRSRDKEALKKLASEMATNEKNGNKERIDEHN